MTKDITTLQAHGSTPMNDNYKLLINNVFTVQELGCMASAIAINLQQLMNVNAKGIDVSPQIHCISTALGKVLLALPEDLRKGLIKSFKKEIGIEFRLEEEQKPDELH